MEEAIRIYRYPDGTMQRVQTVRLESWKDLDFLELQGSGNPVDCFAAIFRQYLIPACPWLFGALVLFSLPEGVAVHFPRDSRYGALADDLAVAAAGLRQNLTCSGDGFRYRSREIEAFCQELLRRDCLRVVKGKLPITTIIPVKNTPGLLSRACPEGAVKVNASFFIMDPFDCATVYDHVGSCLGLMVKDGVILNPPLYGREALVVRSDGTVAVEAWDIRDLPVEIGGKIYRHGHNCRIDTRPRSPFVTGRGTKLVIIGRKVVAVCQGTVHTPASGYVLSLQEPAAVRPGDPVAYPAMDDVAFAIQVGNSILRDGQKTDRFHSKFYNIRHLEPVPYPPSLYPVNFRKSRAARIALGADADGHPVLLWAEGAPKIGYVPGHHSRGASLADMGGFCADAGMVQAVNLDGGGSAQLLTGSRRQLEISDRNPDGSQSERLVPNGLIVK